METLTKYHCFASSTRGTVKPNSFGWASSRKRCDATNRDSRSKSEYRSSSSLPHRTQGRLHWRRRRKKKEKKEKKRRRRKRRRRRGSATYRATFSHINATWLDEDLDPLICPWIRDGRYLNH
jgi:hypothetical protein